MSTQPPDPQPLSGQQSKEGILISFSGPTGDPHPSATSTELIQAASVPDGEPLSEEYNTALAVRRSGQGRWPARVVVRARAIANSAQTAQFKAVIAYRVRQAPRDGVRLCWFFLRGNARWIAKAWRWITYADLRADARAARLIGDRDARRTAQELIRADAAARWAKLGIATHRVTLGALLLTLLGGVLALIHAQVPPAQLPRWLTGLYTVVGALAVLGPWLLTAAPVGWLVAAVWEGRDRSPGAGFLTHPDRDDPDPWIDERMITTALATLNITPLNRFFKDGGQLIYTIPARRDGNGTAVQVRMPLGTKASDVVARNELLAANLGRLEVETWPAVGPQANILDLWIADQGALDGPAPPWPLLHQGSVDVYEGVPWGVTIRGEPLTAPLISTNWLFGALAGQGKTATMRLLALACRLTCLGRGGRGSGVLADVVSAGGLAVC